MLLADLLPSRSRLAAGVGTRRAVQVEVRELSDWARAVADLENRRNLENLLAEGVRRLRRYRGRDLRAEIAAASQALKHLGRLLKAQNAAQRCQRAGPEEDLPPEVLVQALPLRLYALGNWAIDPIEELLAPDLTSDELLFRLATTTEDQGLARLAASLLGARQHRRSGNAAPERLPDSLRRYWKERAVGCPVLCLHALAADPSLVAPPDLALMPPPKRTDWCRQPAAWPFCTAFRRQRESWRTSAVPRKTQPGPIPGWHGSRSWFAARREARPMILPLRGKRRSSKACAN